MKGVSDQYDRFTGLPKTQDGVLEKRLPYVSIHRAEWIVEKLTSVECRPVQHTMRSAS